MGIYARLCTRRSSNFKLVDRSRCRCRSILLDSPVQRISQQFLTVKMVAMCKDSSLLADCMSFSDPTCALCSFPA